MFIFVLLVLVAAVAKFESIFPPTRKLLERQREWMVNYRFQEPDGWFTKLCAQIPEQCPLEGLGLGNQCDKNPLSKWLKLMSYKARFFNEQQWYIDNADLMLS
jgi:hypothetical protein